MSAGKGTRSVTLRLDQPIAHATASAGRFGSASVPVTGARAGTWLSEIRFRGIPARGVQIAVRIPERDRIRLTLIAETDGLTTVPGFVPRPPDLGGRCPARRLRFPVVRQPGGRRVDPVIAEQLGRSHPLARHLDDSSPTWPTPGSRRTPRV
ncbi:hypothetical protein ACIBIZ_38150 [Nonomuraea spiralis]|uniref:hypothetical protein n=1 Tax=Nonomuraea spiralis TaxID=46182 RepID=UPI003793560A